MNVEDLKRYKVNTQCEKPTDTWHLVHDGALNKICKGPQSDAHGVRVFVRQDEQ